MKVINIYVKGEDGKATTKEAKAYHTNSPYLVVHHEFCRGKELSLWTITHVPTGYALVTGIKHRKAAIKACNEHFAPLAGWENVTTDNAGEFFRVNREVLYKGHDVAKGLNGE